MSVTMSFLSRTLASFLAGPPLSRSAAAVVVSVGNDAGDVGKPAAVTQPADEQHRRRHRAHGVAARRSDAEWEEVED